MFCNETNISSQKSTETVLNDRIFSNKNVCMHSQRLAAEAVVSIKE